MNPIPNITVSVKLEDTRYYENRYKVHIALIHEKNQGVSALVLNLPGCVSCGDDTTTALINVSSAFKEAIKVYKECGMVVPWGIPGEYEIPKRANTFWTTIDT